MVGLVVAALFCGAGFLRGDGREPVVVRGPVAFNLLTSDKLERVQPQAGRVAAAADAGAPIPDPSRSPCGPSCCPAYTGDASGVLPVFASGLIDADGAADPNFACEARAARV